MPRLQDFIHKLELGSGIRYIRFSLATMAVVVLILGYNWLAYKNIFTPEGMDSAQLARNLADGKGYTTLFIRPLSMHLVQKRNVQAGKTTDPWQLNENHPELVNPPVYPLVLAGLLKVFSPDHDARTLKRFWTRDGYFYRFKADFLISVFNQLLFFTIVVLVFFLARKLFDPPVAWLSAFVVLGTELFWRFTMSGLSTMLLLLIFMGLAWCVVWLEEELRSPGPGATRAVVLSLAAGVLVAVGGLTRYSFSWVIVPLIVFLLVFGGARRLWVSLAALLAFLALMTPWLIRNYNVCGNAFGLAGYAIAEGTVYFPEFKLQRAIAPDLSTFRLLAVWMKLCASGRELLHNDLPKLGGSWVPALFLVGLLIGYRSPAIKRLRYFLLGCLLLLSLAQMLGRTHLSQETPEVNSENLLILLVPLVIVYGVSLFFLLLDQIQLPIRQLRYLIIALFAVVGCLPLLLAFLPPRSSAVVFPPYYPPYIQLFAGWMKPGELSMSDVPWAVAWYGRRQSVWLPLNAQEAFLEIHDFRKPIAVLHLTPSKVENGFLGERSRQGELSWGMLVAATIMNGNQVPAGFPLRTLRSDLLPYQFVVTDWERWRTARPDQ